MSQPGRVLTPVTLYLRRDGRLLWWPWTWWCEIDERDYTGLALTRRQALRQARRTVRRAARRRQESVDV